MSGKGNGNRSVDVNLDVRLSQVNKPQDIAAPAKVKKGLPNGVFGQFAGGVVGGLGSTVGVTPERPQARRAPDQLPQEGASVLSPITRRS